MNDKVPTSETVLIEITNVNTGKRETRIITSNSVIIKQDNILKETKNVK